METVAPKTGLPLPSRTFPDIRTKAPAEYWTWFVLIDRDNADWEKTAGKRAKMPIIRRGASFVEADS